MGSHDLMGAHAKTRRRQALPMVGACVPRYRRGRQMGWWTDTKKPAVDHSRVFESWSGEFKL